MRVSYIFLLVLLLACEESRSSIEKNAIQVSHDMFVGGWISLSGSSSTLLHVSENMSYLRIDKGQKITITSAGVIKKINKHYVFLPDSTKSECDKICSGKFIKSNSFEKFSASFRMARKRLYIAKKNTINAIKRDSLKMKFTRLNH